MTHNFGRKPNILLFLMLVLVVVLTAACGKTVVRENILSTIESGVGITVSQNKQTQMYEVKTGFIRSQFYSIPTGKVVENDASVFTDISTCRKIASMPIGVISPPERAKVFSLLSSCVREKKTQTSNAANVTPELVSGIRAHTGWEDLFLGMDVSESFAVGKVAVMSPAAVAMYITMAKETENAQAASAVVTNASLESLEKALTYKELTDAINKGKEQAKQADAKIELIISNLCTDGQIVGLNKLLERKELSSIKELKPRLLEAKTADELRVVLRKRAQSAIDPIFNELYKKQTLEAQGGNQ